MRSGCGGTQRFLEFSFFFGFPLEAVDRQRGVDERMHERLVYRQPSFRVPVQAKRQKMDEYLSVSQILLAGANR